MSNDLCSEELDFLFSVIKQRSGLQLSADKTYLLESRLSPVVRQMGMTSLAELVKCVRQRPSEQLLASIVEAMTTNESFFFRDIRPFEQFSNEMMPHLLRQRANTRRIRIWSAAASTGQEPYSLAMCLDEFGKQLEDWSIEILATDLSSEAIARATAGSYSQFEVQRGLPVHKLVKYFAKDGSAWKILPCLKNRITFQTHNLLGNNRAFGKFDIIFIRNVLIYFDLTTKKKILEDMRQSIAGDGFLCLGGTETVIGVTSSFVPSAGQRGLFNPAHSEGLAQPLRSTGSM